MAIVPTKILLAADGSEDSELALQMAAGLANATGAELHVVYVALVSPWVYPTSLSHSEYERIHQEQQQILDNLVEKVEADGGKITASYFRVGRRADDEVIRLSEELDVDLVIVGSRGKSTLERALMGSDSESIVRYSRYPVLVVRGQSD